MENNYYYYKFLWFLFFLMGLSALKSAHCFINCFLPDRFRIYFGVIMWWLWPLLMNSYVLIYFRKLWDSKAMGISEIHFHSVPSLHSCVEKMCFYFHTAWATQPRFEFQHQHWSALECFLNSLLHADKDNTLFRCLKKKKHQNVQHHFDSYFLSYLENLTEM